MKHAIDTKMKGLVLELSDEPGPDFLTTRGLQKGLVAYNDGDCLVQEGLGFGAPILGTQTETYFSKTASLQATEECLVKTFKFDCASQIEMGAKGLESPALRYGFEALVGLYMRVERLQPVILKLQRGLARSFNASCRFIDVEPVGQARVTYWPVEAGMRIVSEFETAIKNPQFIMVNEQGADFFDRAELDGRELAGDGITGWMSAGKATLRSSATGLRFSIDGCPSSRLFAGRERTPYLSWAGLDLHSRKRRLEYELVIGEDGRRPGRRLGKADDGVVADG